MSSNVFAAPPTTAVIILAERAGGAVCKLREKEEEGSLVSR